MVGWKETIAEAEWSAPKYASILRREISFEVSQILIGIKFYPSQIFQSVKVVTNDVIVSVSCLM